MTNVIEHNTFEDAIVAFIDVLGYGNIVKDHSNNIELAKKLEGLIKNTLEIFRKIKDSPLDNKSLESIRNKIIDNINIRWIADTFLVTLQPLSIKESEVDGKDNKLISMWLYFNFISMICTRIMGITGLVFRGGMSIGSYYVSQFDNNLFIFSEAYNNAYCVQKEETARVITDERFVLYLKETSFLTEYPKFFYEDSDKKLCFNFYCFFKGQEKDRIVLGDIKKGVLSNIGRYGRDSRVLNKLKYFVAYHNREVVTLGFPDLVIEIDK